MGTVSLNFEVWQFYNNESSGYEVIMPSQTRCQIVESSENMKSSGPGAQVFRYSRVVQKNEIFGTEMVRNVPNILKLC